MIHFSLQMDPFFSVGLEEGRQAGTLLRSLTQHPRNYLTYCPSGINTFLKFSPLFCKILDTISFSTLARKAPRLQASSRALPFIPLPWACSMQVSGVIELHRVSMWEQPFPASFHPCCGEVTTYPCYYSCSCNFRNKQWQKKKKKNRCNTSITFKARVVHTENCSANYLQSLTFFFPFNMCCIVSLLPFPELSNSSHLLKW